MDIKFEKDYLRELFYDGVAKDKKHRYLSNKKEE